MNRRQLFKTAFAALLAPTLAKVAAFLPAPRPHLTIAQMIKITYAKVIDKPYVHNQQWAESALLQELERQGAIKWQNGPRFVNQPLEIPLDYK